MKLSRYVASFAVLALAFSISAFAKSINSGSFDLGDTARVGSTQLSPGHYKAEWSGPANNLQITILQNGKQVATTQGAIKDLSQRAPYDEVTVKTLDNNTKKIDEIEFNHRAQALEFTE
jgi:hypothetical protein